MEKLNQTIETYLSDHWQEYIDDLKELAQIPAPSNHEQQRAQWCKQYLEQHGAQGVYIDSALNVIFPYHAQDCDELVVFNAHTDVVFPDTQPLPLREENGRLYAPGVGDDTANVIAVLHMAVMAMELELKPKTGILFVLNSGEEGLGNLKGIRQLMHDYQGRISRVLAIDGGYDELVNRAVGSKRYEITIKTEGGHSFASFGNRNAIHYMASMIDTLYTLKVPDFGVTTYNVGLIEGGTSVNTIAQQCRMLYEYRSDDERGLAYMDRFFESVLQTYRSMGVELDVRQVGDRPCMAQGVDQTQLTEQIVRAAALHGVQMGTCCGSTDCNIPLSLGIPAACFGMYLGHGAHTREEYIDIESTKLGLRILAQVLLEYMH